MHALDVLGDPVRRRILEVLLTLGDAPAGAITTVIRAETGISQPAVSQHLRTLREHGFVTVRPAGRQRVYSLRSEAFGAVEAWLAPFHDQWVSPLAALGTEIARGKRERRRADAAPESNLVKRKESA